MVSYQNILAGLVVVLFITTTILSFYVNKYSKENSRNKKSLDLLAGNENLNKKRFQSE